MTPELSERIAYGRSIRERAESLIEAHGPSAEIEARLAAVIAADGLTPAAAVMFEDDARNLAVPHALGMGTVHVAEAPEPGAHVQFHTDDLATFLRALR